MPLGSQNGYAPWILRPPRRKGFFGKKKNLGYMRSISAEGVLSVKPDLILAMDDSGPAAAFASLGQSGIPLFYISSEASPHAALNRITTIAGLVDQVSKGKTLRDSVARGFEKVDRAARATRVHPKVLFVLHMANNRLICGGAGSPADKVLSICGARNVASAFPGYKMFNPEELAVLQPDIVVTMQENGSTVHDVLIENAGFKMTPAGRKNQLVAVNGEALLTFGPRTPGAMLDLIHRFTDLMADT
ncbi:uncharacterized protein LOC100905608 [Galendromus occidentalis]|uniref:Uncharacterized protein LOC100905608 n=1 Tax=Galendromus occidentalis TaxID=34638 RepID=A0AAJ6VVN0_9ACAR|nr:uncharacterized protein LOC100905608 [Galendromus occidentalis]